MNACQARSVSGIIFHSDRGSQFTIVRFVKAGQIRCDSEHERYGPLLWQCQNGELLRDTEEGDAIQTANRAIPHGLYENGDLPVCDDLLK